MGSGTSKSIVIDAKVRTSLEGMDRLRKELKTTLADNKLELSAGSSLTKLVNEYDEARKQLDAIISKGFVTPEESKKSKQLSERVANIYNDIVKSLSKIENLEMPDLKKMFPSSFSAKTSKGLKEIANYYEKLGDKEVTLMGLDIANKELSNMETTLQNLQSKRTKLQIDVDIEAANKRIEEIEEKKKALQNEIYDSLVPKEVRDSQGKTQRERDQEEVKKAQEVYDAAIQLRNNLKKSKARAQSQQDLADLDIINKNERDELAANQLEKAQAKQIKEKLEREVSRRTGANPSRGKGYEAVEDKDVQAQYLAAVDNLEKLRTETAEIKKKYKAQREAVVDRPKAELAQARKNAEAQVKAAEQNLKTAKQAQATNEEARQTQENIAREKAEKFASGEDVQGVSADKVAEQKQYNEQLKEQLQIQEQLSEEKKTAFKDQESKDSSVEAQDIKIQKKRQEILELENALKGLGDITNVDRVFSSLEELGVNTEGIERNEAGLQQIKQSLLDVNSTTVDKIKESLQKVGLSAEEASEEVEKMREGLKAMDDKELGIKQQEREIEDLQQSFLHFFSIGNAIELFKRTVRESIETVKELDAVMTETAVVTDFTVGDMWEKLPTYAKQASQLGASIKDLYGATTLYYQQGLDTNQAMSVGVETMKMARIANMESSDATKAMTAALRGFNMEINETSATRINDVYSELAAITAADTNQIATAMSKTASIASSANMEFETTAALLAQIIETTQEAPETAGTAMKTIIARFTEVKELFGEGLLTGEDEEGESIDINKIDTALKKVGISLKDFLRGEKGIDDIFLELASKWDSLDLATQRYIATTAAGSRQQSRFIAMMSNYDRSMELVNAANNSAGASQEQYEKTLDSMDAKLQKLQNSWDTYVMGLANQEILKGGVDTLTALLDVINSLTNALSGGNGFAKSLITLGTVFAGLKGGRALINLGSEALFDKKIIPEGKTLEQLTGGKLQSVFAGFQKGIKNHDFGSIFIESEFDEKSFRETAKRASKVQQSLIDNENLSIEQRKRLYDQKQLLDAAAMGDIAAGEKAGMKPEAYQKTHATLTGIATAAMGAGTAINLLGGALESLGYEEAGEGISNFGSAVMGLGSAAAMAAPWLKTLGVTALGLGVGIAAIATIITVLPYVFEAIKASTPEGKLEAAKEATEAAGQAAEQTAESYENLRNALDGIDSKYDSLNKMVVGTQQWKDAARELNEEVDGLVEKYPELAGFFEYKNGVLSKKTGANQEIDRLLRQEEVDTYKAKQIHTQAKIDEQIASRNVLYDYGMSFALERETWQWDGLSGAYQQVTEVASTELIQSVAKRVAEENLTLDELNSLLSDMGYELGTSYGKLRSYGELLLADETRYDAQLANNLKAQAAIMGQSNEEVEALDSNLIADVREKIYQNELKALDKLTTEDKQEFADLMGYRRDGDNYYDKITGQKIDNITIDAIQTALASARADTKAVVKMAELSRATAEDSQLSNAISEDGINLNAEDLHKIAAAEEKAKTRAKEQGLEFSEEAFYQDYFGEEAQLGADALGIELSTLINNIKQNIESANSRILVQRKELVYNMNKYSKLSKQVDGVTLSDVNATDLTNLELTYGEEFRDMLTNVFSSLERSGDYEIIAAGYGNFITQALEGIGQVELQEFSDFISDIDWSNPIESAYRLNQEIKEGNNITKQFAQNMTSVTQGFLDAGSQMRYLIQSDGFEGIQDELKTILETNESIGATDVLDLADSYSLLNKMLKNTQTSAAGVAKALEAVTKEEIKVDQLTSAVMASLAGFDSLGSMIAGLEKKISNFDPGIDENFASEFIAQASDTVNENLKKGAVGNNQIDKYLDLLFTKNWDQGLSGDERVARIKELGQVLKKNSENMSSLWTTIATDKTWQSNLAAAGDFAVGKNAKGEIVLSGYEGMNTQDQVAALVAASKNTGLEITETMAELLLTDYKNFSGNHEYNISTLEQDAAQVAKNTLAGMRVSESGETYIDQSELDTIKALHGIDITNSLRELTNGLLTITNFYDEEGSLKKGRELFSEMAKAQKYDSVDLYKKQALGFTEGTGPYIPGSGQVVIPASFDMDQLQEQLKQLGLPSEAKMQIAQDMADSFFQEHPDETLEISVTASDGSLQTLALQVGDSVEQKWNNMELNVKNTNVVNSIVAAFKDTPIPVRLYPNEEDVEGITTEVTATLIPDKSKLVGLSATVTLIPDTSKLPKALQQNSNNDSNSNTPTYINNATGVKNSSSTYPALVGEEGPELIQRADGTSYLSGVGGPEITTIHDGDTVYTAEETKDIYKTNRGYSMPRYSSGLDNVSTSYGYASKSGGKSSDNDEDTWENSFDKLYNLVHKIDEELRQRERIERRYEKLLQSLDADANKIISVSRESLAQLEKERMLQEQLVTNRKQQINAYQSENSELMKYANVTQNDRGEDILRIDWEAINSVTDTEEGERIEEYVSQLEEWFDSLGEAEDALWEIEDAVEEIKERGKEEYFELEDLIKESVTEVYQEEIDELSKINDSINQVNADLVQAIQNSIDKQRRDRDNQRTEDKLAEKQRRLAYLKQDTSGANDMEILRLEKELSEEQEDYTDTLIDQKISELQEQNDKAAKQREQQIKLAQAQLDHYIESGEIWEEVYKLMDEGLDKDSGLVRGSRLEQILRDSENFTGMSEIAKMEWMKDTNNMIAQALAYLEIGRQLEDIGVAAGTSIEFTTKDGKILTGIVDAKGNVRASDGKTYNNVFQGYDGKYYAGENIETVKEPVVESPKPSTGGSSGSGGSSNGGSGGGTGSTNTGGNTTYKATKTVKYKRYKATDKGIQEDGFGTVTGTGTSTQSQVKADEAAMADALEKAKILEQASYEAAEKEYNRKKAVSEYKASTYTSTASYNIYKSTVGGVTVSGTGIATGQSEISQKDADKKAKDAATAKQQASLNAASENFKNGKYYKTGGLADYTGPAWLDGTKSRPELVLNARDTQNFIQLKDILGSIMTRNFTASSTTTENNGDINYDIDINVETIGSDYDVEQVANKVKSMISENGRYRNNNAISLKR